MKILLTGANGFIGRALYPVLIKRKHNVTCVLRKQNFNRPDQFLQFDQTCYFDSLNDKTNYADLLGNIDVVIHLAGCAHILAKADDEQQEAQRFLEINYHATKNLAMQSAQKRVKRFVFISSISVNGKTSKKRRDITEEDIEDPYNSYTVSKFKAEQALKKIEKETGMEVVIIRPPLVYGPNVKGNFLKLLKLVHTGLPLPFAAIKNKRSFIALDNLVDAIVECAVHEKAGGNTFIVSDGQPLSTPQLLRQIFIAMGSNTRLFYFPSSILKIILVLLRKKRIYDRLCGDLSVDSTKIYRYLAWHPKVSMEEGIQKTIKWYLKENK